MLCEDGLAVQERGLQIVDKDMDAHGILVVVEVVVKRPSLGDSRLQHAVRLPSVHVLLLLLRPHAGPVVQFLLGESSLSLGIEPCALSTTKRVVGVVSERVSILFAAVPVAIQGHGIKVFDQRLWAVEGFLRRVCAIVLRLGRVRPGGCWVIRLAELGAGRDGVLLGVELAPLWAVAAFHGVL